MSLRSAISRFVETIHAATIPTADGRLIPDRYGALVLSEAADELYAAVAATQASLVGQATAGFETIPGLKVELEQADTLDGPREPIPAEKLVIRVVEHRKGDPRNAVWGASSRAARSAAFPLELWNRNQAERPECNHQRYRHGDIVDQRDIELAASAERLLALVPNAHSLPLAEPSSAGGDADQVVKIISLFERGFRRPSTNVVSPRPIQTDNDSENQFRLVEEMWTIRYEGKEAHLKHSAKSGLVYIRELLRNQGRNLMCTEIAAVVTCMSQPCSASRGSEVIDRAAMIAYRKRYSDLNRELEDAQRNNDDARIDSITEEFNAIAGQIRSVRGLGGKSRRNSDDVDRVRRRVSMAITRSIKRLEARLPSLAVHLDTHVHLGCFMTYNPDPPIVWTT